MNIDPSQVSIALLQLDGLIAGIESHSEIPVQLCELKMMRALLGGKYDEPSLPAAQPALRPVAMGLFPTMASLQSVIDLANSQLPIETPNAILVLLMIYHNTLLDQVASCK